MPVIGYLAMTFLEGNCDTCTYWYIACSHTILHGYTACVMCVKSRGWLGALPQLARCSRELQVILFLTHSSNCRRLFPEQGRSDRWSCLGCLTGRPWQISWLWCLLGWADLLCSADVVAHLLRALTAFTQKWPWVWRASGLLQEATLHPSSHWQKKFLEQQQTGSVCRESSPNTNGHVSSLAVCSEVLSLASTLFRDGYFACINKYFYPTTRIAMLSSQMRSELCSRFIHSWCVPNDEEPSLLQPSITQAYETLPHS